MTTPIATRVYLYLIGLLLGLSVLIASCSRQDSSSSDRSTNDTLLRPDSEVFGADITLYDGARRKALIEADRIKRFESIDSTMTYTVSVDFLDSLGQVTSNLVGDSGIIRETTQKMKIYGHVVVVTPDGGRLETDSLVWNPQIQKIQTDAYVVLTRGKDVITGWGLEANHDLTHLTIRKSAGTLNNPKKALEQ